MTSTTARGRRAPTAFLARSVAALVLAAVLSAGVSASAQEVRIESVSSAPETYTVFFTAHFSGKVDLGPPGAMLRPRMARPGGGSFDAVGQEPYEIVWNFGDGTAPVNTGVRPTVSHVFGQQGTYTVTVDVSNARGPISSATRQVTIENAAPRVWTVDVLRLDDASRTVELTSRVSDTPKDTLTYAWDFGDGASDEGVDLWRVTHTWKTEGTYTVTLRVSDEDGGEHTSTAEVVVGERPRAPATAPDDTPRVAVPTTTFSGTTSGAVAATLDARVKPIAGLYLQSVRPGVCRFVFSAWDPSTLAHAAFRADLIDLRAGGARFSVTRPQFTIVFDDTVELYRAREKMLQVNTMGAALAGLRGIVGSAGGTPVEAREGIGVDPGAVPEKADDRQPPAVSPFGLDEPASFRHAGGTVDLVFHTHDRAEATFDVRLENTDKDAAGGMQSLAFKGTVVIDLQAARGQGIVSYEGCAATPFTIRNTSPDDDARHERSQPWPRVSFSAPYDPATLDETTFQLGYRDTAGAFVAVATRMTRSERAAVIEPEVPLFGGVRYEARVKTGPEGVLGKNGEELADPTGDGYHSWRFYSRLVFRRDDRTGLEHNLACHVLQTVRDAPLVRDKPAVARIYADWKKHPGVLDADQLESFTGRVTVKDGARVVLASGTHEFVRPDLWGARGISRAKAEHTANLFGWSPRGSEGTQLRVEVQAETTPGTWDDMYYTRCPAAYWTPEPRLTIDYYLMAMGDWFPLPPASTMTTLHTIYSQGEQYALQVFPLQRITGRYRGTMVMGPRLHAEFLTGRLMAADEAGERHVAGVVAAELASSYATLHGTSADLVLGFGPKGSLSGGATPVTLVDGAPGVIYSLFDDDAALRERYVYAWVHEVGHYLLLDHIPFISTTEEQRSMQAMRESPAFHYDGIEGFRVLRGGWTGWNKSSTEGNGEGPRTAPLMFPATVPYRNAFIATHQYHQLQRLIEANGLFASTLAQPRSVLLASTSATLPWIPPQEAASAPRRVGLAGRIGGDGASTWLGPLVGGGARAAETPGTGAYALSLLDADGAVLGISRFDVRTSTHGAATGVFRASIPWSERARSLVVSKGDTVLASRMRSAHAPAVRISSPTPAQRAAGETTISWAASDADGDALSVSVLYSSDGGTAGWSTLALWLDGSTYTIDTAQLEPGPNPTFKIVVSDGFDEAEAQVSIRVDGTLAVLATIPVTDAAGGPASAVQLLFNSDVAPESLDNARITFRPDDGATNASEVAGTATYDADSRTMTITPASPLVAGVRYAATLQGGLVNRFGHPLAAPVTWSVLVGGE